MIYFLERADGRIKIGFTAKDDPDARRRDLKVGAGELVLLGTIESDRGG